VAVVGLTLALLAVYTPAFGQATASPQAGQQQQPANPITQPLALSPEVPGADVRVGITPGQIQTLSMQDAILLALQNNLDIESFRQSVQIAQQNLYSLKGVYDIISTSDVNYRSQTTPVANIFGGGGSGGSFTQKAFTYNFGTNQLVEKTGGYWEVDFSNNRVDTSSTASTLPLQYNSTLFLTFTQPLLRNFSIDQNRRLIKVAKKDLDLSDSQFRQRVIETINSVQRAYWDLVFAIKNEQIARESVELARTQLENNRKMVEAGTLAPIELRSNEAQLEQNKGNVILAMQEITTAENVLKGLLMKDPADKLWNSAIKPTDEPVNTTSPVDLSESVRLALKNRPELDQLRLQIEQKQIDLGYYKNQLKPQVDFVGIFSTTGLAGTPSDMLSGGGGFDSVTQGLINNLNNALGVLSLPTFNPVPPSPRALGDSVPERFQGGYGQALSNVFSGDFKTYQFGVRLSFPWRNRTAEGNYGRTLAEARQLDARQRQLVQSVQIDVRNALQAVEAARQRYEAARAARLAADAQLKGEEEKFRAGLSTNFVVLQRQTDYSTAQGNEVRALTDYNKALADLQRVTGVTLVSNNVQVSSQAETSK
jgi:HAE1 family hydrophobic/amphiphilic exporter-1